jgi:hypothetical protein
MHTVAVLSRRQILAGFSALLVVPVPSLACRPSLHAFVHESGKPGTVAGSFAVGGLFIEEPQRLAAACAAIRQDTGFRCPLRYGDTNRFKLAYARHAVNAFLDEPGARFVAIVTDSGGWPQDAEARRGAHHAIYARLLAKHAGSVAPLVLYRASHRTTGPDSALEESLTGHRRDLRIAATTAPHADIIQLAGFLSGCAATAFREPAHPVKAALVAHLARGLGVASLADARLAADTKFTVGRGSDLL